MNALRIRVNTMVVFEIAALLATLCLPACSGAPSSFSAVPVIAPDAAAIATGSSIGRTADLAQPRTISRPRRGAPRLSSGPGSQNGIVPLLPYDPLPGTFDLFPPSPMLQRIPPNPTANPNTAAWLSKLGNISLQKFQFPENSAGESQDYGFPIYPMSSPAQGGVAVTVHCTEPWGTCLAEGKTVYVDPREIPEDGGAPNTDSHMAFVDAAGGYEYDFWGVQWPAKNGVLTIAWGGRCSLAGNGFTGCASTATSAPLSMGIVRAVDIMAALHDPAGSLPYAIQVATKCSNGFIAPATGADRHIPGCAPQGSRLYLAMHDAEVNATSVSLIEKVILRTIDEDHYGMMITDTNEADGFMMQIESDLTYTTLGEPSPWATQVIPEAIREGMDGVVPYQNVYYLQLPMKGVDLAGKLKFL